LEFGRNDSERREKERTLQGLLVNFLFPYVKMGTSSRIVIPSTSPGLFLSRFSLEMAGKEEWRVGG